MLWNIVQHLQIGQAKHEAAIAREDARDSKGDARRLHADLRRLQLDVDRLSLACTALWELLKESGSFSDEQIRAKIEEVDLRDGVLDGKLSTKRQRKSPTACSECQHLNGVTRTACLYCGAELPTE